MLLYSSFLNLWNSLSKVLRTYIYKNYIIIIGNWYNFLCKSYALIFPILLKRGWESDLEQVPYLQAYKLGNEI